jgi:hypothetical protein
MLLCLIFIPSLMDQDSDHDQVQSNLIFIPSLLDQDPDHDQKSQLYTLRHGTVTL